MSLSTICDVKILSRFSPDQLKNWNQKIESTIIYQFQCASFTYIWGLKSAYSSHGAFCLWTSVALETENTDCFTISFFMQTPDLFLKPRLNTLTSAQWPISDSKHEQPCFLISEAWVQSPMFFRKWKLCTEHLRRSQASSTDWLGRPEPNLSLLLLNIWK